MTNFNLNLFDLKNVSSSRLDIKVINCISAKSLIVLSLQDCLQKKCLIVTDTSKNVERYINDISIFSKKNISSFDKEKSYFSILPFDKLPDIIVSTYRNIIRKIPSKDYLSKNILHLLSGDTVKREDILNFCNRCGYKFVFQVENAGEVAARGGIIDIFSPFYSNPVRIELDGNEISTIRFFNVLSQRWEEKIKDIIIYPSSFEDAEEYVFLPQIFDKNYFVVIDNEIVEDEEVNNIWTDIKENILNNFQIVNFLFSDDASPQENINIKTVENFYKKIDLLVEKVKEWQNSGKRIFIFSYSAERLCDILLENKVSFTTDTSSLKENELHKKYPVVLTKGNLSCGFQTDEFIFISDNEIFHTPFVPSATKKIKPHYPVLSLLDLEVGDYVVHINYGVGKYLGIVNLKVDDANKDFIEIKYAKEEKLYVPVENVNLLRKYVNLEGTEPRLDSLRSTRWENTKKTIREKAKDISAYLRELYSARKKMRGFQFQEDTPWQKELEDSFPYCETQGQKEAIVSAKKDMESDIVMDRLICGDVGFGKTEIALRCAFKAVQDGKQVAILVPTTILAHQHYMNFSNRLSVFPVYVEVLSRFVDKKKQSKIVHDIKTGAVDIVIGTHRLLQKDIEFYNLGLLIIDEEQRFGVLQKEKLKELKKNVDVLTLTATPIPRTLYLAFSGIRDISVIDTSPEDRLSIKTYLLEYNEEIIKKAILEEVERGGQIYYVYNKVATIEKQKEVLQKLVPSCSICISHAQMKNEEIEKTLFEFMEGKYDILLCSTIIENGIDIPNVNTIIIQDAENFGLAQLYQLRGRVGRSSRQAYAYLLYSPWNIKKGKARERLEAIKEFTSLGSSYHLAKRDLEIRGAGNILGKEQSGYIEQVGLDLWCEFLQEEDKIKDEDDIVIDIPVSAFIPDEYVQNWKEKIILYKRMAGIKTKEEIYDIAEEMKDRFGKYPVEVENLFELLHIKILLKSIGCKLVEAKKDKFVMKFKEDEMNKINFEKIVKTYHVSKYPGEVHIKIPQTTTPMSFLKNLIELIT